jgi:hypothetical protein
VAILAIDEIFRAQEIDHQFCSSRWRVLKRAFHQLIVVDDRAGTARLFSVLLIICSLPGLLLPTVSPCHLDERDPFKIVTMRASVGRLTLTACKR